MSQSPPLKLISYNIRKCMGNDFRRTPERILDVIEASRADIAVLQEADRRYSPRPAALPADLVRDHGLFQIAPLATNAVSIGWHGNAILLRRGLAVDRVRRIRLPGLEPRGAVCVEVNTGHGTLRVVGVHLGLLRNFRLLQLSRINKVLGRMPPLPTIILGDFNEWSRNVGMAPLTGDFRVYAPGLSYHAARPIAALDRFAIGGGLSFIDSGVIKNRKAQIASDHLPIWAEVRLPPD